MSSPSRRGLLVAFPGVVLVPALPAAAAAGSDAALIRACAAYPGLREAVNRGDDGDEDDGPAWAAYSACATAICRNSPQTMTGVLAKARAIKVEALHLDGREQLHGTIAEEWALDVVNAVLRLNGGAA